MLPSCAIIVTHPTCQTKIQKRRYQKTFDNTVLRIIRNKQDRRIRTSDNIATCYRKINCCLRILQLSIISSCALPTELYPAYIKQYALCHNIELVITIFMLIIHQEPLLSRPFSYELLFLHFGIVRLS